MTAPRVLPHPVSCILYTTVVVSKFNSGSRLLPNSLPPVRLSCGPGGGHGGGTPARCTRKVGRLWNAEYGHGSPVARAGVLYSR